VAWSLHPQTKQVTITASIAVAGASAAFLLANDQYTALHQYLRRALSPWRISGTVALQTGTSELSFVSSD
jgi:hypothetical protein